MTLISKWTLGGGIAVAAIIASFSLFGSTASAGLDDPGELIQGDLECEKTAGTDGDEPVSDIIQGETVTYEVDCIVNLPGFDEGDPILIGDIAINDQLPDNFDIEFATCEVFETFPINIGGGVVQYPAQVSGQNVTCVFPVTDHHGWDDSRLPDGR